MPAHALPEARSAAPLSQFVNLLWLYEGYTQPHAKERILPTGEMQIVINLLEDRSCVYDREDTDRCQTFSGSLLSGAHSRISGHQHRACRPPSSACISGPAARSRSCGGRRANCATPPCRSTRYGARAAHRSAGSTAGGATHQARFEILERALLSRTGARFRSAWRRGIRAAPVHGRAACDNRGGVSEQIGLSPKRFIQVFRDETGFTPKVFCRIRRFQRALDRMEGRKSVEWANVALDCGYFDQAHFIHDFRAFSGINPSSYLAHRTPHRNHVPWLTNCGLKGQIFYNTAPRFGAQWLHGNPSKTNSRGLSHGNPVYRGPWRGQADRFREAGFRRYRSSLVQASGWNRACTPRSRSAIPS